MDWIRMGRKRSKSELKAIHTKNRSAYRSRFHEEYNLNPGKGELDDYIRIKEGEKKEKVTWAKVKDGKTTKIPKPKSIDSLLDQGYTVGKTTEIGDKTTIKTYSPLTREEHFQKRKKQFPYTG